MSRTTELDLECPRCHVASSVVAVLSFNPNQHPGWKGQLLAGGLNRFACGSCGGDLVADVEVLYCDDVRRQLFFCYPRDRIADVDACIAEARRAFEGGFGDAAAANVRAIRDQLMVRVCFGLDQLRDKVLADDEGLSDLALEELKCRILEERADLQELGVLGLSLVRVTPDLLEFTTQSATRTRTPNVTVVRSRYTEVLERGHDALLAARPSLARGPHVSMLGALLAAEPAP